MTKQSTQNVLSEFYIKRDPKILLKTINDMEDQLNDLKSKHEEYTRMKARITATHKKFYNKKFVITKEMSEKEKEVISKNKGHRNTLSRARYNRSPEQQERAKQRARERYIEKLSDEERIRYFERKRAREVAKNNNSDNTA